MLSARFLIISPRTVGGTLNNEDVLNSLPTLLSFMHFRKLLNRITLTVYVIDYYLCGVSPERESRLFWLFEHAGKSPGN